jgi:hypothetical protein
MAAEESTQQVGEVDDKTAERARALFDHIEDQINCTDTNAQVVLASDAILVVMWLRAGASARATLAYSGGIVRRSEPAFMAAFLRQSRAEIIQNILAGVHATAHIAQQ